MSTVPVDYVHPPATRSPAKANRAYIVERSGGYLHELSAENLVLRAVHNAVDHHKRKGEKHPRWVAVMETFALGSTYSKDLCRLAGLDPDELVSR